MLPICLYIPLTVHTLKFSPEPEIRDIYPKTGRECQLAPTTIHHFFPYRLLARFSNASIILSATFGATAFDMNS